MSHTQIKMYGTQWCSDCKRTKKFFGEQRVHYEFIDVDMNAEGLAFVEKVNDGKQIIPTLQFEDGSTLVEPSNAELAAKLGLQTSAKNRFYDLIVVGSGPAGLTAALYAAREGIDTLVIERGGTGGQAGVTERLDNFPGFPEGISGAEFADRLARQAERFGVEILSAQEVIGIDSDREYRCVRTADGTEYSAWSVLVVGGGNSAREEGIFLTKFAKKVTIATRDSELSASRIVAEKVRQHPQIEVITNASPAEFKGDKRLQAVVLKDTQSGKTREVKPAGVFVFIGLTPNSGLVKDVVETDAMGFIKTDASLQTS